ncbi:MAG TPA: TetR family transcriptional regulator [Bacteroidia bacterium]|jgi:AcrR family transcriptional regulator|nr:TetR family transcriptional regulator [Bacteroidia bacterium]
MKQLKDTSTEDKILDAAKEVFMKYGLYGARMQDIADTAGINKALLHYYFRNKEKLFDRIFENALSRFFESAQVFDETDLPVKDRVCQYVSRIIDFYAEYPQMSMFIIKEIGNNPELFKQKVMAAKKNKSFRLIPSLEEAMQKGEIAKIDTALFMINLQSLCSFPFLASPMFKHSLKSYGKDWNTDFSTEKLKKSVYTFIENTLKKNTNK